MRTDTGHAGAFDIEITREMISAGLRALESHVIDGEIGRSNQARVELVLSVFLAMGKRPAGAKIRTLLLPGPHLEAG